jgi:hypothetical protein
MCFCTSVFIQIEMLDCRLADGLIGTSRYIFMSS